MDDLYYSKKLNLHFPTRLDFLLYAHDGRGLGHASRAVAIGMALRRLYPEKRVLLVTGAKITQSLIGTAELDWIKLPSYASMVQDGVSTGVDGPAKYYKSVLGLHRSGMLSQIICSFRPKCVLVDHSPLGKRKELMEALKASQGDDICWILGIRAVVGTQKDFWSEELKNAFQQYYQKIFWYGDSKVTGVGQIEQINNHFGCQAKEMGYVSRMHEVSKVYIPYEEQLTGTIAIPWLTDDSRAFLRTLRDTLAHRPDHERWHLFINEKELADTARLFQSVAGCRVRKAGEEYAGSLLHSKMAVVYGGYNSMMDILAAKIPAIIVERHMQDNEQQIHVQKLKEYAGDSLLSLPEGNAQPDVLHQHIDHCLAAFLSKQPNLLGSEQTAKLLHDEFG